MPDTYSTECWQKQLTQIKLETRRQLPDPQVQAPSAEISENGDH